MRLFFISILLAATLFWPIRFATAVDAPPSTGAQVVELENPLGPGEDRKDVPALIGTIIRGILSIIGAVILVMFVWGSQAWITAAGNPEKIKTGWKTMVFASIGAIIIFFAYLLLRFMLTYLGTSASPPPS